MLAWHWWWLRGVVTHDILPNFLAVREMQCSGTAVGRYDGQRGALWAVSQAQAVYEYGEYLW